MYLHLFDFGKSRDNHDKHVCMLGVDPGEPLFSCTCPSMIQNLCTYIMLAACRLLHQNGTFAAVGLL